MPKNCKERDATTGVFIPLLAPKLVQHNDGMVRPSFVGTLLFPPIRREGYVLEHHDDGIFFRPKEKLHVIQPVNH